MKARIITKEEEELLLSCYNYDPLTGHFYWKVDRGTLARRGNRADSLCNTGYRHLQINKYKYAAHRAAWFFFYGVWPSGEIDHINGVKEDNRIENLRDVSPRENNHNRPCHRNGQIPGIVKTRTGFYSHFHSQGDNFYSSYVDSREEAISAYLKLREEKGHPVKPQDDFCKLATLFLEERIEYMKSLIATMKEESPI